MYFGLAVIIINLIASLKTEAKHLQIPGVEKPWNGPFLPLHRLKILKKSL